MNTKDVSPETAANELKNLSFHGVSRPEVPSISVRHTQSAVKKKRFMPLRIDLSAEIKEMVEEQKRNRSMNSLKDIEEEVKDSFEDQPKEDTKRKLSTVAEESTQNSKCSGFKFRVPDDFDLNQSLPILSDNEDDEKMDVVACTPKIKVTNFDVETEQKKLEKELFLLTPSATTPYNQTKITNKKVVFSTEAQHVKVHSKKVNSKKTLFTVPIKENLGDNLITVNAHNYKVLALLGRGGSSVVHHCEDMEDKQHVAIKCVDLDQDQSAVSSYLNEVKTLKQLQHCSRVVKLYDFEILQEQKKMYMVLEKGTRDLASILNELARGTAFLPCHTLIYYWMEMLYAVQEIHNNGVIHSDLKPANFIESKGMFKLIDFGIASCVQNNMTSVIKTVTLGTFSYISPEALHNEQSQNVGSPSYKTPKYKISYKSDVWSLGCILYQLVYRRTPFQHLGNFAAKIAVIMDPNHRIDYPKVSWPVPPIIIGTLKRCLRYDMRSRPSIRELITEYEALFMHQEHKIE